MLSFKSLISVFLLLQTAAAAGYVNAAYYATWTSYSGFEPYNMQTASLTHVIYAFTKINTDGTISPGDIDIDEKKMYAGDVQESGTNTYGAVKQLYLLKKQNRKLKTLLSVGGYTASQNGDWFHASRNSQYRTRFVNSAIKLMLDWGMDGIDLDWEYPQTAEEGEKFLNLIILLRQELDKKSAALGQKYKYIITAATPAGSTNYANMPLAKMNSYVDYFFLMTYDFSGSWSTVTSHASNLYHDKSNPSATPISGDAAVADYIKKGVSASKINLGLPLYGNAFSKTDGLGKKYTGHSQVLYKDLPRPGANVQNRATPGAQTTWDASKRELISYDGDYSGKLKANYVKNKKLAGTFFWEASGDKTGSSSLVRTVGNTLSGLENTNNQLAYPSSKFANMRNGMPSSRK
jgi:chitinase